jgi:hypothetical protein
MIFQVSPLHKENQDHRGVSINVATPLAGWFIGEKPYSNG